MKLSCIIAVLSALLTAATNSAWAIDAASIFGSSKDSVVLLVNSDEAGNPRAIGSGFVIGDGTRIATNLHVIEGASHVVAKTISGQVMELTQVAAYDEKADLAILVAPRALTPLSLKPTEPDVGQEILAIGNPKGLEGTVSTGIVSGIRSENGLKYYQITAPISPGSSGGPILTASGEVVGVASFYVAGGQNLNFAMPSTMVRALLNQEDIRPVSIMSDIKPPRQERHDKAGVRLIETNFPLDGSGIPLPLNARNAIPALAARLDGYVQNLTSNNVSDVTISILYFKGKESTAESNRGYEECNLFPSQIRLIIHSNTAEKFSCSLSKLEPGFRIYFYIKDYKIDR